MNACRLLLRKRPGIRHGQGEVPYYAKLGLLGDAKIRSGYQVSWSKKKSRRKWYPDVQWAKLHSRIMDKQIPFMVTPTVLQRIDQMGGVDSYLLQADTREIEGSEVAMEWRRRLQRQKTVNDGRKRIEEQAGHLARWLLKMHKEGGDAADLLLTLPTNYGHFGHPDVLASPSLKAKAADLGDHAHVLPVPDGRRILLLSRDPLPGTRPRGQRKAAKGLTGAAPSRPPTGAGVQPKTTQPKRKAVTSKAAPSPAPTDTTDGRRTTLPKAKAQGTRRPRPKAKGKGKAKAKGPRKPQPMARPAAKGKRLRPKGRPHGNPPPPPTAATTTAAA